MSCGVGLDPKLLWCRSSLICSLAWEPPYAVDVALKRQKKKKKSRERQIPYDITYIWNLVYYTNEPFHRKETHGLGEQTYGFQGGGGGSGITGSLGLRDANYLLHLEWINTEILVYSTGNYIQSLVMEHDEG